MEFNWFDVFVVIALAFGFYRGRQRGISIELPETLQWLAVVAVGSHYYRPLGIWIARNCGTPLLLGYLTAYTMTLCSITLLFGWIKARLGDKLMNGDVFGRAEYYSGSVAGGLRIACLLMVGLALLNAKYVSPQELAYQEKMQKDNFGDISFPTFASVQYQIFRQSVIGSFVKKQLSEQLIEPTNSSEKALARESMRSERNREIDELLGSQR
jgi:uncharacterized membrane protein required for colicin V production